MNTPKKTIYFGITDMCGTPEKMDTEQKEKLSQMLADEGQYDPVFCQDNGIPKMVGSIIMNSQIDKDIWE